MTAHLPLESYLHLEAKTKLKLTWTAYANHDQSIQYEPKVGKLSGVTTPIDHLKSDVKQLTRTRA